MKLNNNMAALFALNELNRNSNRLGKAAKKAAAGLKLNSAGDDASGYSISEKMRVQLRALSQDVENVQTGRNMVAVAEGGIQEIIENLRYIKEKAINAANDHNTDAVRAFIQKEVDA
ncbi:MAG: flagellin, partial [Selenomonadaceae bacterium]|nr:flagellin [Selenomonadaceae bacterium]